jgi:hypothetical protein
MEADMRRSLALLVLLVLSLGPATTAFAAGRDALFLELVRERHIPPVTREAWGRHVGDDCVWIGKGLAVATRAEVSGLQIDTGKKVEITDFVARDYGTVAVLTYLVTERQPQDGTELTTRLRKMDTYAQRDGRWQLIANAEVVGRPDRVAIELDPATHENYTGTWEATLGGKPVRTRLWRDGAKLMAQTEGQPAGELRPQSPTLFFDTATPEEGGPENIFVLGPDGRAIEWIYREGDFEVKSRRVP